VTKSHINESMKAMKFLLQKNALKLYELQSKAKKLKLYKTKEPSELTVWTCIVIYLEAALAQILSTLNIEGRHGIRRQ